MNILGFDFVNKMKLKKDAPSILATLILNKVRKESEKINEQEKNLTTEDSKGDCKDIVIERMLKNYEYKRKTRENSAKIAKEGYSKRSAFGFSNQNTQKFRKKSKRK